MPFPEESDAGCLARRAPAQFEIAIGGHSAVCQRNGVRRPFTGDVDCVVGAGDRIDGKAGVKVYRDADGVEAAACACDHFGVSGGRDDVGCTGQHGCARQCSCVLRAPRDIARADDQRHPQRIIACDLRNRGLEFDLHQHCFARPDIGDGVPEHVRAVLFDQTGLLAVGLGLLVDFACFLARLDPPFEDAIAHHHLERVDRAVIGQGVEIGRLHPFVGGVTERLRHRDAGSLTVDIGDDIGAQPHCGHVFCDPSDGPQHQPALAVDRGWVCRCGFGACGGIRVGSGTTGQCGGRRDKQRDHAQYQHDGQSVPLKR